MSEAAVAATTRPPRPFRLRIAAFITLVLALFAAVPSGAVLFLGVGPTGLASAGWVWLVHRRGALFGSMPTYLSPVWATLLGVAVLGERPGGAAYAALALILAGVAAASRTPRAPEPPAIDSPEP